MQWYPSPRVASVDNSRVSRMFQPGASATLHGVGMAGSASRHATMHGACGCGGKCGCSTPEILKHGTMSGFLRGLGDNGDDFSFDTSGIDISGPIYDPIAIAAPDFGGGFSSGLNLSPIPIAGPTSLIPAMGPIDTTMIDANGALIPPNITPPGANIPTLSSPGGVAAPGTAALATSLTSAATQLTKSLTSSPTARAIVPSTVVPASSFLNQSSIIPGVSNQNILLYGALAALALALVAGGKKSR